MGFVLPVAVFVFTAAITPGPNNFLVMAAGASKGYRSASEAIAGVLFGGLAVLLLSWAGVAAFLERYPAAGTAFTLLGASYLAWIGLRMIVEAGCAGSDRLRRLPATFFGVALFQVLNPKTWLLTVGATLISVAGGSRRPHFPTNLDSLAALAAIIVLVTGPSLLVWATVGARLRRWLSDARRRTLFDRVMGVLLIGAVCMWLRPQ